MSALWRPLHLLLLDHALAYHLVDRGLDEGGTDAFSIAIPLSVVDDKRSVVGDVRDQLPHILEYPSHRITFYLGFLFANFVAPPVLQSVFQILELIQCPDAVAMPQVMFDAFQEPLQTRLISGVRGAIGCLRPR